MRSTILIRGASLSEDRNITTKVRKLITNKFRDFYALFMGAQKKKKKKKKEKKREREGKCGRERSKHQTSPASSIPSTQLPIQTGVSAPTASEGGVVLGPYAACPGWGRRLDLDSDYRFQTGF